MALLRELVMKMAIADQNLQPLLPSQIAKIEEQIQNSFPAGLHTPIHPPYPAMIFKAITELNEEGGSSEDSISECIKANYKDLPFAHRRFLSLHLRKLCDKGFLLFSAGKRYTISLTEGMKRSHAKRELVFEKQDDQHEMCNTDVTKASLTKAPVLNEAGESSKGMVKKKKEDFVKWMTNAFSDLPGEEKAKRSQMLSYLQALVKTRFFTECKIHSDADNSKCNSFCLDCMNGALCNLCRVAHADHCLIRVNKTMWENVVTASHVQMYIDISGIQTHHLNGKHSLSLRRTLPSRRRKNFTGACCTCKRFLPDEFKFCSLYCKFEHEVAFQGPSAIMPINPGDEA